MKFDYGLPAALIGVSIAIVQPQVALALSSTQVSEIAEKITVRIEGNSSQGSGVIIQHSGDTYYILTCKHVVENQDKYTIVTPGGESYPLDNSKVKKLPSGLDLAVVQFNSKKPYTVAKLGNSDVAKTGTLTYVYGFPESTAAIPDPIGQFLKGDITANASEALDGGYALVYSNNTRPGMSGGPVLNENGEVVGVHGRADTTADEDGKTITTGFNLGIPINTFLASSSSVGVGLGSRVPSSRPTTAATADNFYIQAADKYKKADYQGAIADLNQAIKRNPNYAAAYSDRGATRGKLGDYQGTIEDSNSALRINPNFAQAYLNRGVARLALGDKQEAIEDFNQALRINPNFAQAYLNRGIVRFFALGDKQEAIEDFNQALRIDPIYAPAYAVRGIVRAELGDKQGALADLQRAAELLQQQGKADTDFYQNLQRMIAKLQQ